MEELKRAKYELLLELVKEICVILMVSLELLFLTFGVAYILVVGSLFIKLFATTMGTLFVLSGTHTVIKYVKQIRICIALGKLGKVVEDFVDKNAELNK